MERLPYAGLILAVLLSLGSAQHHCRSRFGDHIHEECHSSHRDHATYQEFEMLISDAVRHEREPEFPIHLYMEMYKYAYECASNAEAAFHVFVLDHTRDFVDVREPTQEMNYLPAWRCKVIQRFNGYKFAEWIHRMNPIFENRHHGHFSPGDLTLLHEKIQALADATTAGCVRYSYQTHGGAARDTFYRLYPDFHPPTAAPTTKTTTPTPPTTTPTPPTTTPTMPTTTFPTTPTTSPTTPAPIVTSTAGTTSKLECTVCDSLECLLHVHVRQCDRPEHEFCFIEVHDAAHGRNVRRGCADNSKCPATNPPGCADVDNRLLAQDTVCTFCCRGNDCNHPPSLQPVQP